jgi:fatty-acyl-CoA synthase
VALVDAATGERVTYRVWNARANQTSHLLVERLGVRRGDRVAVLAHNCLAYLDVWQACNKLGAILVNLNWRLAERELAAQLALASPTVLVYGRELANVARALPGTHRRIAIDEPGDGEIRLADREGCATELVAAELDLDAPSVICFTGGSTGTPKGVVLTHGNITWNAINTVASWGLRADDTAILNAPLFHTGGLNVFTAPLIYVGGTSILCRGFDCDQVFDLVGGGDVTLVFGVPTMFLSLQEHARWSTTDLSRLRIVISGGAPCPLPVFEKFWARGVDFTTGYGLTEAGPNTFWLPRDQVRAKPGAVGYPLMHVEVRLVDGELHVRGPHVTPGYWNNPEATAAAIDAGGWLHTGDLAQCDADGAYTIVGRKKDMFISGGENVYPAEVESVLAGHRELAAVAVVGVPDERWGEVGCAVVVRRDGAGVDAPALREYCRANLAAYKVPKHYLFVAELPTTTVGKLDRPQIVELARRNYERAR